MHLLGRTNRSFPPIWLSLSAPQAPANDDWLSALVEAALLTGAPLDISSQPALWGGCLRGTQAPLVGVGGHAMAEATSQRHAFDLVQAQLLETLCGVGRDRIEVFFLRVRSAVEEFQVAGALEALSLAKEDGTIGFLGLCCDGPPYAALGLWQFHDAFELCLLPRNHLDQSAYDVLAPLAQERRAGVVTCRPLNWGGGCSFTRDPGLWRLPNLTRSFYGLSLEQAVLADLCQRHPVLVGVRTAKEAREASAAATMAPPPGLDTFLEPFREAVAGARFG